MHWPRFLLLSSWLWWTAPALAEEAITAPVAETSTEVPYPDGAAGHAAVVLEIVVETDGTVSSVEVIEGTEPFAERARAAARSWRFRPARRGETAVAARIRARVEFERPEPDAPPPAASEPAPSTGPPEAAPQADAVLDLTVVGERPELGQTRLSAADVREMPGAFGDPFRAVEALPGVTPALSGVPYFFVRGAPPNNNGYFVDGVRVPLLFHVGLGPGVIHPALLERIDFFAGAAPARYGGVAGAIVAGHTRAPASVAHGEVGVRLVDAGGLLESPFAGGRGSGLVAGRYGYPGPILSAISDARLGYWDYQSRLTWRTSERASLGLLAFGSHDYLGHKDSRTGADVEDMVSDFHRLDLRYDHALRSGRVRLAATGGYDRQGANPVYLIDHSAGLRLELEQQLVPSLRLRSGGEARLDAYAIETAVPIDPEQAVPPTSAAPPRRNVTASAYADIVWRVLPPLEFIPGARVTLFSSSRARSLSDATRVRTDVPAVDPHVALRVFVAPAVTLLSDLAISHQYPVLRVGDMPVVVAAGAGFPDGSAELQRALQASQGVELTLPAEITLGLTGFLSRFWGLTDLTAQCTQIEPPTAPIDMGPRPSDPYFCPSNAPVQGHAYGLELLLRRPLSEQVSGWLSYTLSRSVREAHFLRLDGSETVETVPGDFDRTHVLNAILAFDLGRHWRAGSRFVFYTGVPYSELVGNLPAPPYNQKRDPPFYRLDLRLEKRWLLLDDRSIAFVFEVLNATLSQDANTLGMDCIGDIGADGYTTRCQRGKVGPITLPSIGVEAVF